jgi:hypothetical protein
MVASIYLVKNRTRREIRRLYWWKSGGAKDTTIIEPMRQPKLLSVEIHTGRIYKEMGEETFAASFALPSLAATAFFPKKKKGISWMQKHLERKQHPRTHLLSSFRQFFVELKKDLILVRNEEGGRVLAQTFNDGIKMTTDRHHTLQVQMYCFGIVKNRPRFFMRSKQYLLTDRKTTAIYHFFHCLSKKKREGEHLPAKEENTRNK